MFGIGGVTDNAVRADEEEARNARGCELAVDASVCLRRDGERHLVGCPVVADAGGVLSARDGDNDVLRLVFNHAVSLLDLWELALAVLAAGVEEAKERVLAGVYDFRVADGLSVGGHDAEFRDRISDTK